MKLLPWEIHPKYKYDPVEKRKKYEALTTALKGMDVKVAITFPGFANYVYERMLTDMFPSIRIFGLEKKKDLFKEMQETMTPPSSTTLFNVELKEFVSILKSWGYRCDHIFADYCGGLGDTFDWAGDHLTSGGILAVTTCRSHGIQHKKPSKLYPFETAITEYQYSEMSFSAYRRVDTETGIPPIEIAPDPHKALSRTYRKKDIATLVEKPLRAEPPAPDGYLSLTDWGNSLTPPMAVDTYYYLYQELPFDFKRKEHGRVWIKVGAPDPRQMRSTQPLHLQYTNQDLETIERYFGKQDKNLFIRFYTSLSQAQVAKQMNQLYPNESWTYNLARHRWFSMRRKIEMALRVAPSEELQHLLKIIEEVSAHLNTLPQFARRSDEIDRDDVPSESFGLPPGELFGCHSDGSVSVRENAPVC
jgi:hypothetical protein